MNSAWKNRYELALEATQAAARLAQRYFDGALVVEWKADESPVTVADREAELLLRQKLSVAFPGDGFLGEEHGSQPGTSGYRWIIDPIDGTRNFVRGIPIWATLVGLEYQGELIAGIAQAPAIGQCWRALRGDGAFRNDKPMQVSSTADLAHSMLFYSSLSWFIAAGREEQFLSLTHSTDRQRGFGDFYGHVLVAQGAGELMVEHGVHAWDVAALKPIVEEAGGRYSTWDGSTSIEKPDVIVSNGKVHDAALAILGASPKTRG